MKKIFYFLITVLFSCFSFAQTIQDLGISSTLLNNPYTMIKVGNIIYYTNSSPTASSHVYKFDYTIPNAVPSRVNTTTSGFSFLTGLVYHNGFLYVAANNCIWKIDTNVANAVPQVFYYNDSGTTTFYTKNVFTLFLKDNDLYFNSTSFSPTTSSKLLKINLLDTVPNPVIVQNNIPYSIGSLVNIGNIMYFSTLNSGNGVAVCKFDLTNSAAGVSSVINDNGYICRMAYYKNRIYFPNETSGTVKSFDPLDTNPTSRTEFTLSRVAGLLDVDCDLYVGTTTSSTTNRMVKVRLPYVTGNATQSFDFTNPSDITIEDLIVTGTNITWFNSSTDANANINPIAPNTQLVQGNTYYAVATDGVCRSLPFAVTTAVLSNEEFGFNNFKIYPNPTKDFLNIEFNEIVADAELILTNTQGQLINKIALESLSNLKFEMPQNQGIYFLQIKSKKYNKTFKIIKE